MVKRRRKRSQVIYGSKIARFPIEAYMNYVFYSHGEDIVMLYPFENVYPTITALQDSMQDYATEWDEEKANGMEIAEVSIVVPISFAKLYPLRAEFWNNPDLHFEDLDRFRGFWKAASKPEFYKMLVTPTWNGKKLSYHAAIALYITATNREIDNFMLYSDFPVDERAKYAAVYTFGHPLRFNWKTGEVSRAEQFAKPTILH
ncbi:hypothetical protein HY407_02175 [Candidatus Gottesmanbacteria bacterium]|nr:hypothetical protein [Candidatus Gottesmanbacteria bacterium]